ncbi:selenide, water dikinase SelD [uncultured Bartonella sp.]|uniref:selenide, water dikinase SelD n=1 Tax=uncultured Bartonella sp. TaxID=104108 RepID=UPI00261AE6EE|nr:selenide, water dikinase SelD [uncultured Bartonella sp.]
MTPFRLTSLAHGGGCGCKIAPSVLQKMLKNQPEYGPFKHLLVGTETSDDAAVYELDDGTCVIATTDFFMPMVDDPLTFGQIAATNAISDVYAMGGKPIMALAILGMPVDKIDPAIVGEILKGGRQKALEAGIAVAGGHSIDNPEPVYGLAVIGICDKKQIKVNASARAGDKLVLMKGIGVGVYSHAFKTGKLSDEAYKEMIASMTLLNKIGTELGNNHDVHALTDVTGFGILGHSLEMAQGSNVQIDIYYSKIPFLTEAETLAKDGCFTGASRRNWDSYGEHIVLPENYPDYKRFLLTDPQTSGGLLLSVAPDKADGIVAFGKSQGYPLSTIIGEARAGSPRVVIKE